MTTRLLLLCGLLALASAAPVITFTNNAHFRTLRPEPRLQLSPCDYCQDMVQTFERFLADPQTQAAVSEYIEANVCAGLPTEFAPMCQQEVPMLVATAADTIASALTPSDLCGVMGVCPNGAAAAAQLLGLEAAQVSGPFDCPMCKMVVMAFVQRLQDRESRAEIEATMRAACDNLGLVAKARCLQDVTDLFRALDNLLHDVDPEGVCEVVDFCQKMDNSKPAAQALRTLRAAAQQLATGGPAAAGANDICENCKTIVLEAAAILQDPKTQAELLEYAKEGCTVFQDFKDQCELYVTLYGPLVFNMAVSYLQPDSLCTRIGYCPAAVMPLGIS